MVARIKAQGKAAEVIDGRALHFAFGHTPDGGGAEPLEQINHSCTTDVEDPPGVCLIRDRRLIAERLLCKVGEVFICVKRRAEHPLVLCHPEGGKRILDGGAGDSGWILTDQGGQGCDAERVMF